MAGGDDPGGALVAAVAAQGVEGFPGRPHGLGVVDDGGGIGEAGRPLPASGLMDEGVRNGREFGNPGPDEGAFGILVMALLHGVVDPERIDARRA